MQTHGVILIGGSLGSHEAIRTIVRAFPADLRAMVFIAVHRSDLSGSDFLPVTLARIAAMPVKAIRGEQEIKSGNIYVAPGRSCLEIGHGGVLIESSNLGTRPGTIDAMFRSGARSYGEGVIGVVLSGLLDDGSAGFREIRKRGGVTIAQDPNEAERNAMPQAAMQRVPVDFCLRAAEIGPKLVELVNGTATAPVVEGARIMIVEDEWLFASELQRQLTELGYEVVAMAATGQDAIARVESARPDLAIMDVGLAGSMTGTETARRLWEEHGVPIIYLTAHLDQQTVLAAGSSMPYAFLPKPHLPGHLHATIQLLLSRRKRELERAVL